MKVTSLVLLLLTVLGCSEDPKSTLNQKKGIWIVPDAGNVLPTEVAGSVSTKLLGICRAELDGAVLPGSLRQGQSSKNDGVRCIIPFIGKAHDVASFEILTPAKEYKWLPLKDGEISQTPVIGGQSRRGNLLYICRVNVAGEMIVGKIRKEHGSCLFPHDGSEEKSTDYWILDASS